MPEPIIVDARGLSCPQPVLETKKAIEKVSSGEIHVLVDTMTSRMNVGRFAGSRSWAVEAEELPEGGFRVILKK
ncbi:MAG: sulfurtransferase TusA family protein [Thermovirgaceae bacterium]